MDQLANQSEDTTFQRLLRDDAERFITLVKTRQTLWNKTKPTSNQLKQDTWMDLCTEFHPPFQDYPQDQKQRLASEARKLFQYMKNQYFQHCKDGASFKPYFRALGFLDCVNPSPQALRKQKTRYNNCNTGEASSSLAIPESVQNYEIANGLHMIRDTQHDPEDPRIWYLDKIYPNLSFLDPDSLDEFKRGTESRLAKIIEDWYMQPDPNNV